MKILIIDTYKDEGGHHKEYLENILLANNEYILLLGKHNENIPHKQYIFEKGTTLKKTDGALAYFSQICEYINLVKLISKIISIEKPDICHFLYGDSIFKFAGIGLKKLNKKCKIIMTFHHFRFSLLRNIFRKIIFKNISIGIIHTSTLLDRLKQDKIYNAGHIEYPCFDNKSDLTIYQAKEYWKIPSNIPVLVAMGGTRHDKGLDILLEALKNVTVPFYLLIAGKEESIKSDYINQATASYKNNVKVDLRILTDEEFKSAIMASDFVILPYRKIFNGASGPLVHGVMARKTIIGSSFGSIGDIIRDNHIGYTFESEDINDLTNVLNNALSSKFQYDDTANRYVECLNLTHFQKKYADMYSKLINEGGL